MAVYAPGQPLLLPIRKDQYQYQLSKHFFIPRQIHRQFQCKIPPRGANLTDILYTNFLKLKTIDEVCPWIVVTVRSRK